MTARPPVAATPDAIAEAAGILRRGGLVAFPTETVYGLGADATNTHAVAGIFTAKGRPAFNPLIVHLHDLAQLDGLVIADDRARALAEKFWPGPLTMVLPRAPGCPVAGAASAGLDTLAVRMPDHPVARALLQQTARPLVAPSANRSGAVSPTQARHVAESLGDRVDMILDGGPCRVGVESTVIDLSTPRAAILRPGFLTPEDLSPILGPLAVASETPDAPKSPGQLLSHYAPGLPVRLDAAEARPGEAFLAFGQPPGGIVPADTLSETGDPIEAAARLFACLRALDRPEFSAIAVAPIPDAGIGRALNDRLRRAAAPRTVTK